MKRSLLVLAGVGALALAAVLPVQAASAASGPIASPPSSVHVTGTAALDATVTWARPHANRAKIVGYTVQISPAEHQRNHGIDVLGASARSARFTSLTPGTTYRLAVRTVGKSGPSSAVTVTYTAPKPVVAATQYVFALSAAGAVERFPTAGGAGQIVVPTGGAGYTVDNNGDVFVPTADGTAIVEYPVTGAASRTVASGLAITGALQMDVPGDLFFVSGTSIVELPVTGAPARTVAPASTPWAVAPDGTVSTITAAPAPGTGPYTPTSLLSTYPTSGASTVRTITYVEYPQQMLVDAHGTVYVEDFIPGGSGAFPWDVIPAGSSTLASAEPTLGFDIAAVNSDHFLLLQAAQWCNATAEQFNQCNPAVDRTVPLLRSTNTTTGAVTTTSISGLTIGAPKSLSQIVGAADDAGDVFMDVPSGPTSGLYRVSATGGAVTQLDAGQFTRVLVNRR